MLQILKKLSTGNEGDTRGLANVEPSNEKYFGEQLRKQAPAKADPYNLVEAQYTSMRLYETRVASMQRFVAFCVMFHELGLQVQDWWASVSFGILAYRMDRTHSIMRIATTASPISGAEVRDRMQFIAAKSHFHRTMDTFRVRLHNHRVKKEWMGRFGKFDESEGLLGKFDESEAKQKLKETPVKDQLAEPPGKFDESEANQMLNETPVKDQLAKPPVGMDIGASALGITDRTDPTAVQKKC